MAQEFMEESFEGYDEIRPVFYIGQHDSARTETLTDLQYGQILNSGVSPSSISQGYLIDLCSPRSLDPPTHPPLCSSAT